MKQKKRIGLLFGGRSAEHEVSLASATSVMQQLDQQKYEVLPLYITRQGSWLLGIEPQALLTSGLTPELRDKAVAVTLAASPDTQRLLALGAGAALPDDGRLDLLFPVLHGPNGEDGTVQGLFELANIPYVGCGVLASAVSMNKSIMKQLFQQADLPVVPFLSYRQHAWQQDPQTILSTIETELAYPCFIKPANLGSSIGVSRATHRQQLSAAIELALSYDRAFIVEQGLDCREFSCAILGNDAPRASVVGEILPGSTFSDYNDKYLNHTIQFVIPAEISTAVSDNLREMALRAYQRLDLRGLARVDFFLNNHNGRFFINEVNTLPGFTSQSLYPQLWAASGLPYAQLLDRLLELALER